MKQVIKLSCCSLIGLLASCGHMRTVSDGYAESSKVEVNGAEVNAAFFPNGGSSGFAFSAMIYAAGTASVEGPFLWRIQARGDEAVHQELIVHRVRVKTQKSDRTEWFPQDLLGKKQAFLPFKQTEGKAYAYFQMPGELKVLTAEDGGVSLDVDLSIKSAKGTVRKLVNFSMQPSKTKETEFIFLPTEIKKGMQKDPREWNIPVSPEDNLNF